MEERKGIKTRKYIKAKEQIGWILHKHAIAEDTKGKAFGVFIFVDENGDITVPYTIIKGKLQSIEINL